MENFCYEKETLRELASHVKTGEPLPDELIENLKKKRQFLAGISTLRQASHSDMID
jgi:oligopeptidase A